MGRPLPLKVVPSSGGSGPHLIRGSFNWAHPGPYPKGISMGSAVFTGLTVVTDRPTDRQTTLLRLYTVGRIYVRTTAMRHK